MKEIFHIEIKYFKNLVCGESTIMKDNVRIEIRLPTH